MWGLVLSSYLVLFLGISITGSIGGRRTATDPGSRRGTPGAPRRARGRGPARGAPAGPTRPARRPTPPRRRRREIGGSDGSTAWWTTTRPRCRPTQMPAKRNYLFQREKESRYDSSRTTDYVCCRMNSKITLVLRKMLYRF